MNNSIIVSEYQKEISRPFYGHLLFAGLVCVLAVFAAYQVRWPLKIDLANADERDLSGYYNSESEGAHKFRWTNGNAEMALPDVGQTPQVRLNIRARAWRTETAVFSATVTVNGHPVGVIDRAGWRDWSWVIANPTVLSADRLVVGIQSTPFRFDELFPDLEDSRELGVSIESAQIEQPSVADSNFLNRLTVPATSQVAFGIILVITTYLFSCFCGARPRTALYHSIGAIVGFAILIGFFGLAASQHFLILASVFGFIALSRLLSIWPTKVALVPIPFFLIALLANGYLGFFARYIVDDYCNAGLVLTQGLLNAQQGLYLNWSGRYTSNLANGIVGLAGHQIVPFLPLGALTLWLIVLAWAIFQLRHFVNSAASVAIPILFAAMVVSGTIAAAPNIAESLFWDIAMLANLAPLPFLTFVIGLVLYAAIRKPDSPSPVLLVACADLTFLVAGFQETSSVLETTIFFLLVALCILVPSIPGKRALLPLSIACLVGSILGMVIMIMAPGNAVRQAAIDQGGYFPPQRPGWLSLIGLSIQNAAILVKDSLVGSPLVLAFFLMAILVALAVPSEYRKIASPRRFASSAATLGLPLVLGFLLVVACFVPAVYATSSPPPERGLIIPVFVVVCTVILEGYLIGHEEKLVGYLRRVGKPSYSILLLLLAILIIAGPISFTRSTLDKLPSWKAYAQVWDKRDLEIRKAKEAGVKDMQVQSFYNPFGLPDIGSDPDGWLNKCTAYYYGLDSIVTK